MTHLAVPDIKVEIKKLSFFYARNAPPALKNISISLFRGQITALIGPSGCGKSTLLRVLNRIYALYPEQYAVGEVVLDGENVLSPHYDLNLLRSRVGMVFQKATPFPMSIYENVAFGMRLYEKLTKKALNERVEAALRRTALWDEVKDRLKSSGLSLSGGQQQRLCIARAIAVQPEVIVFDEPTSALDPIATVKIEELIDDLRGEYTIAIVTHSIKQAEHLSDFAAFLSLGEMVEFGNSKDVFSNPRDKRTQDYIGGHSG